LLQPGGEAVDHAANRLGLFVRRQADDRRGGAGSRSGGRAGALVTGGEGLRRQAGRAFHHIDRQRHHREQHGQTHRYHLRRPGWHSDGRFRRTGRG
jgi:hypothetical protein